MLFDKTRIPAMVFCTAFHLMNSRLFSIGKHSHTILCTYSLMMDNCIIQRKNHTVTNIILISVFILRNVSIRMPCDNATLL